MREELEGPLGAAQSPMSLSIKIGYSLRIDKQDCISVLIWPAHCRAVLSGKEENGTRLE